MTDQHEAPGGGRDAKEAAVDSGFRRALNLHGYGFQYAVLNRAAHRYGQRRSMWSFATAEFPVENQGTHTKIDFVLQHRDRAAFLVAECKRANPALSHWCFAQIPVLSRVSSTYFVVERLRDTEAGCRAEPYAYIGVEAAYGLALEVRADKAGDAQPTGSRGAIEEATAQVLRGVSGLANTLGDSRALRHQDEPSYLMPVVFTTANLWTTKMDIDRANLATGALEFESLDVQSCPWLVYQYHQSPSLRHGVPVTGGEDSLGGLLKSLYARSVAIVSASGIDKFLEWSSAVAGQLPVRE